jgi:translation initiation factor IF-3
MIAALEGFGRVEREPKLEGKMLTVTLTPSKKGNNDKAENT